MVKEISGFTESTVYALVVIEILLIAMLGYITVLIRRKRDKIEEGYVYPCYPRIPDKDILKTVWVGFIIIIVTISLILLGIFLTYS